MENCKIFIVRHAYKYAHYHSYIHRDINAPCIRLPQNDKTRERKTSPDSSSVPWKFMPEALEAVHDDDCDIKIKISSRCLCRKRKHRLAKLKCAFEIFQIYSLQDKNLWSRKEKCGGGSTHMLLFRRICSFYSGRDCDMVERNKNIYQPRIHGKGWKRRKIDKIRDLIWFDCEDFGFSFEDGSGVVWQETTRLRAIARNLFNQ